MVKYYCLPTFFLYNFTCNENTFFTKDNLFEFYSTKLVGFLDLLTTKDLSLDQIIECIEECSLLEDTIYSESDKNCEDIKFWDNIFYECWFADPFGDSRLRDCLDRQSVLFENYLKYIEACVNKRQVPNSEVISTTLTFYSKDQKTEPEAIEMLYNNFKSDFLCYSADFYLHTQTPEYIADELLMHCNGLNEKKRFE